MKDLNPIGNLYHVQDGDRPLWVIAKDWQEALLLWRHQIRLENPDELLLRDSENQPDGISFIADVNDVRIPLRLLRFKLMELTWNRLEAEGHRKAAKIVNKLWGEIKNDDSILEVGQVPESKKEREDEDTDSQASSSGTEEQKS